MPAPGINLADANVWLALAFSDHAHHSKAMKWFEAQAPLSCAFCRVTQMALLRHLTNATIMGPFVQSQQAAWKHYDNFMNDPRVIFLAEPSKLEATLRVFTRATSPSHGIWRDAYLAALAIESTAQAVTFDQGFRRFPGLDLFVLS